MTIPASTAIGGPYVGDGIQTDFPFGFKIFESSDIDVTVNDGTTSTVISSSLYSVTIDGDAGGTVVLNDPLTDEYKLSITRNVVLEQSTNLEDGQAFFADTLERMSDDLTMQTQYLEQKINQTVTFDPNIESADELYDNLNNAVNAAEQSATDAETAQDAAEVAQGAAEAAQSAAETAQGLAEDAQTAAEAAAVDAENTFIDSFPYGLTISNNDDLEHDIAIAPGRVIDYPGGVSSDIIELSSILVKQIDADWVAGTNAGGFPSGLTLGNNTWYHLFIIKNQTTEAVDAGFDTALDASNLLADATGYFTYKRIGSVLTDGSANIISGKWTENGNSVDFMWDTPLVTYVDGYSTTAAEVALNVPSGISTKANIIVHTGVNSDQLGILISDLDQPDIAPVYNANAPSVNNVWTIRHDQGANRVQNTTSLMIWARPNLTGGASGIRVRSSSTISSNNDKYIAIVTRGYSYTL